MAEHRFRVGEQVRMAARYPDPASHAVYEIVRLMPETPNGELHYRVKNPTGQERAASESQLSSLEDAALAAGS
jgi:hypothetical protein